MISKIIKIFKNYFYVKALFFTTLYYLTFLSKRNLKNQVKHYTYSLIEKITVNLILICAIFIFFK
ncbi:hypothetical protein KU41_02015 [Clostridium botulinum]|nr:hypothetical protein KU41_02015 [Clostridium botulinum]